MRARIGGFALFVLLAGCGNDTTGPQGPRFDQLLNTLYSNIKDPARMVVSDSASWAEVWALISSGSTLGRRPDVDFRNDDVIVVALGERRRAGYAIRVEQVEFTNDARTIHILQTTPADSCTGSEVIITPLHAIVVTRSTQPTRFVERIVITPC